jgi:actin-related protein
VERGLQFNTRKLGQINSVIRRAHGYQWVNKMGNKNSSSKGQPSVPAGLAQNSVGDEAVDGTYSEKFRTVIPHAVQELFERRVILDNGAETIRMDIAGSDGCRKMYSARIVKDGGTTNPTIYCGYEAERRMKNSSLGSSPFHRGVVTNWDDMEKVWNHGFFNELRGDVEKEFVLTDSLAATCKDKENMTQIMFETFNVGGMSIWNQQYLSFSYLNNSSGSTGVLVDSGDSVTWIVPFVDGFIHKDKVVKIDFGGLDITEDYVSAFAASGSENLEYLAKSGKWNTHQLKKNFAMVRTGDEKDEKIEKVEVAVGEHPNYLIYDIPGSERFASSEILFGGRRSHEAVTSPLQDQIWKCISSFESEETRKALTANVVLSGGNTCIRGFEIRLKNELEKQLVQHNAADWKVKIRAQPIRFLASYSGANHHVSYNPELSKHFYSRQDYNEVGPSLHERYAFKIFSE